MCMISLKLFPTVLPKKIQSAATVVVEWRLMPYLEADEPPHRHHVKWLTRVSALTHLVVSVSFSKKAELNNYFLPNRYGQLCDSP